MKRWMFLFTLLSLVIIGLSSQLSARPPMADDTAEQAKYRKESAANLRKIVIAMHNYHNDYDCMPPHAMYDKAGKKALLSWRVTLLPYLGHDDLFKKFKWDESWDSTNNKSLIKEMPEIYAVPGVKSEPGMTHYQVFTMPLTLPAGKKGTYVPMFSLSRSKLTLGQLTVQDGTSNTICVAEAAEPVIWTKPADMLLEHDDAPFPKLGIRPNTDEFLVAFADGSTRELKRTLSDKKKHARLMKQLIGRKDGMNEDVKDIMK